MNLTKNTGHYIVGVHSLKGRNKDICESIQQDMRDVPSDAVQICTHGPQVATRNSIDIQKLLQICKYMRLFIHEPYVIPIWKNDRIKMEKMLDVFTVAQYVGAHGVVIHLPKREVTDIVDTLKIFLALLDDAKIDVPIILETPSNKPHPTQSWESPEKLCRLIDALQKAEISPMRVGICIDTAHIYVGGAQITTRIDVIKYLKNIPIGWIQLFHLNGNVYEQGTRYNDKHAIPFANDDMIWGQKNISFEDSGCKEFIEYAKQFDIPVVFEKKSHHSSDDICSFIQMCGRKG